MNAVKRRLIGLNLAVLMILSVIVPAAAVTPGNAPQPVVSSYFQPAPVGSYSVTTNSSASTTGDAFPIVVGNASFYSTSDRAGTGWYYHAKTKRLELTDYQGGSIRAEGNLTVQTKGTVTITGTSGGSGIDVSGSLSLLVGGGSLTVIGGSAATQAGRAVSVSGNLRLFVSEGAATFLGGDATASGGYGGHALYADRVYLSGEHVTAIGGDGFGNTAGCGIYANSVSVHADCALQGGVGSVNGPGIFFFSICDLGVIDATIAGGGPSTSPIQTRSIHGELYCSPHTTFQRTATNQYTVQVRLYELLLHGSGGVDPEGNCVTTLQYHYSTCFDLQKYVFRRDGYVQTGWTETSQSGAWIALNAAYCPATDTDLYAYWVRAGEGDILLNGLGETFSDSSHWQKYSGSPVALPDTLSGTAVPAWGSEANPTCDERNFLSGIWYAGNDTVQPNPDSATVLYARTADEIYTVYHPTLGSVAAGGTILLQSTTTTSSDLITYTPDASVLLAPNGYEFVGWSDWTDGEVVYAPGALITRSGRETVHLYAVWESTSVQYVPEPGVTVLYTPGSDRVQVVLSDAWCAANAVEQGLLALYDQTDAGNRMKACSTQPRQAGQDLVLEISFADTPSPYFSIFSLTGDFTPAAACISFDLSVFS